jgi:integrase
VDFDTGTCFVPKQKVTGSRGRKRDHFVHLSPFALRHFRAQHARTGTARWCLPGRDGESHVDVKPVGRQVGDRQHRFKQRKALANRRSDNSPVLSGGENGGWTPHDLCHTAARMMRAPGVTPDVIDGGQNRVLAGGRVRRHYLEHDCADETKQAWAKSVVGRFRRPTTP